MAHKEQQDFIFQIKQKFPDSFKNKKILEVGSCNKNGTVRIFFEDCEYIGLDVSEGPLVDIICFGHEYNEKDESFDTVISSECFEHDFYYEKTFKNMIRLCKKKGLVVFTCATVGRAEHGTIRTTPNDSLTSKINNLSNYYKNLTSQDFQNILNFENIFIEYEFKINNVSHDLYFYGIKK